MNSVMQCLKRVNELKSALTTLPAPTADLMPSGQITPEYLLTYASGGVFKSMEIEEFSHKPVQFIMMLRRVHPLFDDVDPQSRVHRQ